jgi:hypothetical protein
LKLSKEKIKMIIDADITHDGYISKKFPSAFDVAPWQEPDREISNWFLPHYINIKYRFNRYGFRDINWNEDDFPKSIFCFGCSQTVGVGIEEDLTWTKIVSKKLEIPVCNMGITGASNDTISRTLISATSYCKPKAVFCLLTNPERREIIKKNVMITVFPRINEVADHHKKKYIDPQDFNCYINNSDEVSDQYNRDKNILLIKSWCESQRIDLILADYSIPVREIILQDMAADGRHIGKRTHEQIANFFTVAYKKII